VTLARIAIRAAVVTALKAGIPALGDRVFPHRAIPLQTTQLPAALVYTTAEAISELAQSPVHLKRALRLVVHVRAAGNEAVEDQLDTIAGAVETVLYAADFSAVASDWGLSSIEGPEVDGEGERYIGDVAVVWEFLYETDPLAGELATDDFELAHIELETHEARTGPEAEADVELEVAAP
jgi:hypothetical protein